MRSVCSKKIAGSKFIVESNFHLKNAFIFNEFAFEDT